MEYYKLCFCDKVNPSSSFVYTSGAEALAFGILRLRLVNLPYIFCRIMEVAGAVLSGTGYSLPDFMKKNCKKTN